MKRYKFKNDRYYLFMKGKTILLTVLAALGPLCLQAQGIADIARTLSESPEWSSRARYVVSMPNRDVDVEYRVKLGAAPAPADTLAPCAYIIDWELDTPSGPVNGWTSYFDGNLYRYRDHRIREYHMAWDPAPFRFKGTPIQNTTQFAELLPAYLGRELQQMLADTTYTIAAPRPALCEGRDALRIDATMDVRGERVKEKTYWLDARTLMPIKINMENNPASITEQTVTVTYEQPEAGIDVPVSESELMELYPEHFEKYRESNFRIENLAGTPMPGFTLPTSTGERYMRHRGDAFRAPTVIALIEPGAGFNDRIVRDLREAAAQSPVPADIIWAIATTNPDEAESVVPSLQPGEHLLMKARTLARDCGVADMPVVIVAGTDGIVKKVILGYNPNLSTVVLQSVAM